MTFWEIGRRRLARLRGRRLAIFAAAAVVLAGAAGSGGRLATSLATSLAAAIDADALIAGRSPGTRGVAELAKVKPTAMAAADGPARQARALPRVRAAPAEAEAAQPVPPAPFEPFSPAGPDVFAAPPATDMAAALPGPFAFRPPIGGIGGGGIIGGGGGGGIPGEEPGEIVPEPAPAIPEPATWMMLIGGFGAIGWTLRRRQTRERRHAG